MRTLLLTSAAFVALGVGSALAVELPVQSAEFTVTSSLAASCSIATGEDTEIEVGPEALVTGTGDFETTCNFEAQDMTVSFESTNGGVANLDEPGVEVDYTITYGGEDELASNTVGSPFDVIAPAGPTANLPVPRTFTVALVEDLTIAGDYSDTLTVTVAP